VLHHFEQWTLREVSARLERSPVAVAGLIKRALRSLRLRLEEPP
jgi:DNA-directed RNA polymerase specialized sigma24 family protein